MTQFLNDNMRHQKVKANGGATNPKSTAVSVNVVGVVKRGISFTR